MKRTFIAVKIKPEEKLLKTYTKLKNELDNEKIKWVNSDNFHLTLFFLGDTTEEQMDEVKQNLSDITEQHSSFAIKLQGIGVFKNIRKPRVLWVGIRDLEKLKSIKISIDEKMKPLGFQPDNREFKPHLTLARIKWLNDKNTLSKMLEENESEFFQQADINQIVYYESILKSTGPVYRVIEKYPLGSPV
jgi:2'-5' RNA ligase